MYRPSAKATNRPEYRWSDFSQDQQAILKTSKRFESTTRAVAGRNPGIVGQVDSEFEAGERLVVRWLYLEEKSVAEICDLTGWKPSKIKVTAFRARQKLASAVKTTKSEKEENIERLFRCSSTGRILSESAMPSDFAESVLRQHRSRVQENRAFLRASILSIATALMILGTVLGNQIRNGNSSGSDDQESTVEIAYSIWDPIGN